MQQQLDRLIAEKAYLEAELTIAKLAKRSGTPVKHLRQFIKQTSGHRNFRDFLNSYRIVEAKQMLAGAGAIETSILTVALDSGFASLASFNRVFKDRTGESPRDFRANNTAQ